MRRLAFFIILAVFFLPACSPSAEKICSPKACFSIETVKTDADRARGLMFRKSLDPGTGMFFIFDAEDVYPFWMKNMLFPIDILWLDKNRSVVYVAANVPPCRTEQCPVYTPLARAMYVLEIPAGAAVKYGIMVGDILR